MKTSQPRQTIQKTIVWDTIQTLHNHPSADDVYEKIHKKYEQISRATVCRILNDLAKEGKMLRLHMPYSADRYDYRVEKHWHIQCHECGKVIDVPAKVNDAIDYLDNNHGFKITGFLVVYEGICKDCQKKSSEQ
jgi:Fe2+ or Zn2+ uptake regulation protein